MLLSLKKCKRVDIYSLICEDNPQSLSSWEAMEKSNEQNISNHIEFKDDKNITGECLV